MSIHVENVDIREGDSVFLKFNGSAELSLAVHWPKGGLPTVQGPMNVNSRAFTLATAGWVEQPRPVVEANCAGNAGKPCRAA